MESSYSKGEYKVVKTDRCTGLAFRVGRLQCGVQYCCAGACDIRTPSRLKVAVCLLRYRQEGLRKTC